MPPLVPLLALLTAEVGRIKDIIDALLLPLLRFSRPVSLCLGGPLRLLSPLCLHLLQTELMRRGGGGGREPALVLGHKFGYTGEGLRSSLGGEAEAAAACVVYEAMSRGVPLLLIIGEAQVVRLPFREAHEKGTQALALHRGRESKVMVSEPGR